ncbi:hypothetical protein F8M41_011917 [Gigaspora margarita]|uniref:F-box domain-containing protein n=1 Tax=Gigaspora margarita TaxID=4874 RepID=A0A8H3X069_GIGMA|nr:hypothetical protein F8M41_011917 [Gigaspora margarita]
MASKIFMGDIPELMEIILNNLNNEIYSLYSCALVSRQIFYLLGRNEQFFSQLQDLSLGPISDLSTENTIILLKILAKDATKLNALKLDEFHSDYEPQLLRALICIIKSQEQLRQFSLVGEEFPTEFHGIISALESQNNSLQEVSLMFCEFSTEFMVLMNCKNLEILRIRDCYNEEILEISLKTLEITGYSIYVSNIVQILKKSGTLLQRLSLVSTVEHVREEWLLLETLKSFCPNITYLNLSNITISTQFLGVIGNLQKLKFLTLFEMVDLEEETEIIVMQFAKLLPLTLQYLDLRDSHLGPYFDILLNNCYAPLKYLLIDCLDDEKAKALVEFCIRKRTLNYIGVSIYLDDNIKKEVERYVTFISCDRIEVNC